MITRIFRATIHPELRDEFEDKFKSVSVEAVKGQEGLESVTIHKPTKWSPDEYLMISVWQNEDAIKTMAGHNWNKAFIPKGMEKYILECWLHHFEDW